LGIQTAYIEEVYQKEIELIKKVRSNDPNKGYNRWPKFTESDYLPDE